MNESEYRFRIRVLEEALQPFANLHEKRRYLEINIPEEAFRRAHSVLACNRSIEMSEWTKQFSDNLSFKEQIDILARYLMQHHGDKIGEEGSEGAIECALRLLGDFQDD